MPSLIDGLIKRELIKDVPSFLYNSVQYEVIMGSVAYGVSSDLSDMDIYGFCIPYKEIIFPHLAGDIVGFGRQKQGFEQFQKHHIQDISKGVVYDVTIYNIVKYFMLCMENNPNMIDSLFTPQHCILQSTAIANYLRERRKEFLHKGAWHKFKGYAFSQVHKMTNKSLKILVDYCLKLSVDPEKLNNEIIIVELNRRGNKELQVSKKYSSSINETGLEKLETNHIKELYEYIRECSKEGGKLGNRLKTIIKFGFDVKFAYHVIRLLNEIEQILIEGDLTLDRNREQLKSIRNGEWSLEMVVDYFNIKEKELEKVYIESKLPHSPNEPKIKQILIDCLEIYFGKLEVVAISKESNSKMILEDLQTLINKYTK
jgi:hypothetical protein